ncbi:unnamed protein product [Colias eurytheme]|nr:unnamed protein product [Colias eurytheme]
MVRVTVEANLFLTRPNRAGLGRARLGGLTLIGMGMWSLADITGFPVSKTSAQLLHLRALLKVTALREHWDEANARVLQRKAQLDAMLGDSQRYEARRRDADAWLTRMETRLAAMTPPGHTADVLEMQLREQKVVM